LAEDASAQLDVVAGRGRPAAEGTGVGAGPGALLDGSSGVEPTSARLPDEVGKRREKPSGCLSYLVCPGPGVVDGQQGEGAIGREQRASASASRATSSRLSLSTMPVT
jgi:hypothetical protein